MALELNEALVIALRDKLDAGLPAAIDALNADVPDDTYLIEHPVHVLDYIPDEREISAAGGRPLVGIQDVTTTLINDAGSHANGQHQLAVLVYLADPERANLARALRRYQRALATVCLDGRAISDVGYGVTLRNAAHGPTLDREEDPRGWLSFTGVVIACWTDE